MRGSLRMSVRRQRPDGGVRSLMAALCCACMLGGAWQLDGGGAAEAFGMPDMRRQILALAKGDVLEVRKGLPSLPYHHHRIPRRYMTVRLYVQPVALSAC